MSVVKHYDRFITFGNSTLENLGEDQDLPEKVLEVLGDVSTEDRASAVFEKFAASRNDCFFTRVHKDGRTQVRGNAFQRMFLRVPNEKKEDLDKYFDEKVPLSESEIKALQKGDLNDRIFRTRGCDALALSALHKGKIDQMDVAKIFLYLECKASYKNRSIMVHLKNNPKAQTIFKQSLNSYGLKEKSPFYTQKQIDEFLQKIEAMEEHETQFFIIRTRKYEASRPREEYNIFELLLYFSRDQFIYESDGEICVIIFPPKLLHELYKIIGREHTMSMNPVFGYSLPEDFQSRTHRDVYIPNCLARLPERVHNVLADKLGAYFHDANYHLYVESMLERREVWIELAKLVLDRGDKDFWNHLLDREYSVFMPTYSYKGREFKDRPYHEKFWATIIVADYSVANSKEGERGDRYEMVRNIFKENKAFATAYKIQLLDPTELFYTLVFMEREDDFTVYHARHYSPDRRTAWK